MIAPTDMPKDDPNFRISDRIITATEIRRDVWPSKKHAFELLKGKAFADWDEEVLRLFVVLDSYRCPC